jgi:hypothetical protein
MLTEINRLTILIFKNPNCCNYENRERVAELVARAPACYGSSLGLNPDIFPKIIMGDVSKGVVNTLYSPLKYIQNIQHDGLHCNLP